MQTSVSSKLLPKSPKNYLQSIGYWYVFSQKRSAGMLSRRPSKRRYAMSVHTASPHFELWTYTILFLHESYLAAYQLGYFDLCKMTYLSKHVMIFSWLLSTFSCVYDSG